MYIYVAIAAVAVLIALLVNGKRRNTRMHNSDYERAVKRLYKNNPDIHAKMKDKYKV